MTASPIVSAIVTFHNEGAIALDTLEGMERVRRFADKEGILVEFVAVLDCADAETLRIVPNSPVLRDYDQIVEAHNRDLGTSRNSGVQAARGQFIGIFDGDDFYSDNWLVEALKVARINPSNYIVHPECQISFGATHCIAYMVDMNEHPNYPLQNCLAVHPWIACSFGAKTVYESTPYCRCDTKETGFGFEDWQWNLETISKGALHVHAKETAHYYRRKSSSMLTEMVGSGAVIRPSAFFDHPERWNLRLRAHALPDRDSKHVQGKELIPDWAVEGMRRLAPIDPTLNPTSEFLGQFILYSHPYDLAPGELYAKSIALLGGYCPDLICLVPWLAWGDKDDSAWQEPFALRAAGRRTLVISSVANDSERNSGVPEEFKLLEFGELSRSFSEDQQIKALTRLVLQSTASEVYVINSQLGWKLVKRHSKSFMATGKKIYASVSYRRNDQNNVCESSNGEISQWLREFEAGNVVAQAQIVDWERKAQEYAATSKSANRRSLSISQSANSSLGNRIIRRIKRYLRR